MTFRVCRYIRVSRLDQDPQLQFDETDKFIAARGWDVSDTYLDHGISGTKDRRPALDRMLVDAEQKAFSAIVCYRSDRLFRSVRHLVNTIDVLNKLGIGFISATEPFDSTTTTGRLTLMLCGAVAEFERSILVERSRAGVAAARRRGVQVGRPRRAFDLHRARTLRADGKTLKEIQAALSERAEVVSMSTLSRLLGATTTSSTPMIFPASMMTFAAIATDQ